MRKKSAVIGVFCLAFLILLAGCYQPGGPVPEGAHAPVPRDYTQEQVDAVVVMEEQVIPAPLPDAWGAPEACDEIHFLRFRPRDGSTLDPKDSHKANAAATDAMLVMLPGLFAGANDFEYMARQMVYMAKTRDGKNIEIWSIEHRNNRLEDITGLNYLEEALRTGSMTLEEAADVGIGYYYHGKPINGKTFAGFQPDTQFLSEFGLKLDTEDVFKVIQTLVPDQSVRKEKVFVGGHSLGGIKTSLFAGWDLDGNPATTDDAGYNNCAGLFGLDTTVNPLSDIIKMFMGFLPDSIYQQVLNMTEPVYSGLVDGLRNGSLPPILNPPPILDSEIMALLEALSIAAYYEPDAECTLIQKVPYSPNVELILRLVNSCDLQTFMEGKPETRNFLYTNEALLGAVFDDSFSPIGVVQYSMGFLQGGPVVEKSFPVPGVLKDIPIVGDLINVALGYGHLYIANDAGPMDNLGTGPLYSWVNFDEVGDASDPNYQDTNGQVTYTTMENEVSDIRDVARCLHGGPLNMVEWYFSNRLLIDIAGALMPYAPKYGLNFLHGDDFGGMPQVLFLAEQGVLGSALTRAILPPGEHKFIKGYNHVDVLTASANTSSRRPNEVFEPLLDFVWANIK